MISPRSWDIDTTLVCSFYAECSFDFGCGALLSQLLSSSGLPNGLRQGRCHYRSCDGILQYWNGFRDVGFRATDFERFLAGDYNLHKVNLLLLNSISSVTNNGETRFS